MDTVGKNKKVIAEYIKNQLQEDIAIKQISIKEEKEKEMWLEKQFSRP